MEKMAQRQQRGLARQNAFISSTQLDLVPYRQQVKDTLLELGFFPIGMEQFVPDGGDATTVSMDRLAEAQVYIGIIGWRYGYIPADETRSVTHLEYLAARRSDIPCFLFLTDAATETDFTRFPLAVRDPDHAAALQAFRAQIMNDVVVKFFTTPEELALQVSTALVNFVVTNAAPKQQAISPERKVVLNRVQHDWIKGMLDSSLEEASFIPLELLERPDLITNPLTNQQQEVGGRPHLLPVGTTLKQIYAESEDILLVVGDPGAGKTTLVLNLAKHLLREAALDETARLPVVFPLAAWASKGQPLGEWMIEEMITVYQLPRGWARSQVEQGLLLPVLDGLDEVREDQRAACVAAINAYHEHNSLVPLIIGSRLTEYAALSGRIVGGRAVQVQALTPHQIATYLRSMPGGEAALQALPLEDPDFQEIAENPLMLRTLMVAYQGKKVQLDRSLPLKDQKQQIFADYVEQMLKRGQKEKQYAPGQIKLWLHWLAQRMLDRSQIPFYLERMQMDWLSRTLPYKLYFSFIFGFVSFLFTGTANSIFFQNLSDGLKLGLIDAGLATLFGLLLINGAFKKPEESSADSTAQRRRFSPGRLLRLISWRLAVVAPTFGIIDLLAVRSVTTADFANSHGLLVAVYFAIAGNFDYEIRPAEMLVWSWESVRSHALASMAQGLGFGTLLGLYNAILYPQGTRVFLSTLAFGVSEGLVFGILLTLLRGFSHNKLDSKQVIKPNQGIRNSLSNSFRLGLFAGLTTGPIVYFFYSFVIHHVFITGFVNDLPPHIDVVYAWVIGLALAYLFWLLNGGFAVLQHYVLRFTLWRHHHIPWRYISFLDFAHRRILLRKIGGGYTFIHKLILEYFADLGNDDGPNAQPSL